METPRLMDLIRRLRYHEPDVGAQIDDDGTARIVWRHDYVGHPLTLLTIEQDLSAAVTAITPQIRPASFVIRIFNNRSEFVF